MYCRVHGPAFPYAMMASLLQSLASTRWCLLNCCAQAFGTSSSYFGGSSYSSSYYSDILSYNPYGRAWGYDDDANSYLGTNDYSGM